MTIEEFAKQFKDMQDRLKKLEDEFRQFRIQFYDRLNKEPKPKD
jgi:DNA-binding protein YbaB